MSGEDWEESDYGMILICLLSTQTIFAYHE